MEAQLNMAIVYTSEIVKCTYGNVNYSQLHCDQLNTALANNLGTRKMEPIPNTYIVGRTATVSVLLQMPNSLHVSIFAFFNFKQIVCKSNWIVATKRMLFFS